MYTLHRDARGCVFYFGPGQAPVKAMTLVAASSDVEAILAAFRMLVGDR